MARARVLQERCRGGRERCTTLRGMKKLLILAIVGAIVAAIVYKVMASEVPVDVQG